MVDDYAGLGRFDDAPDFGPIYPPEHRKSYRTPDGCREPLMSGFDLRILRRLSGERVHTWQKAHALLESDPPPDTLEEGPRPVTVTVSADHVTRCELHPSANPLALAMLEGDSLHPQPVHALAGPSLAFAWDHRRNLRTYRIRRDSIQCADGAWTVDLVQETAFAPPSDHIDINAFKRRWKFLLEAGLVVDGPDGWQLSELGEASCLIH